MKVSILVPYRSDKGYRERAWAWVSSRWSLFFPEFEIVLGDKEGLFSRSAAINDAAKKATGDVFIIADCDTTFNNPSGIKQALMEMDTWALAQTYEKLTKEYTDKVMNGDSLKYRVFDYSTDFSWSGIVIVKAFDFWSVGGFDERFIKWGEEDICFGLTMNEVAGPVYKWPGSVCHLWHPQTIAETYGHSEWVRQRTLADKYRAAVGNKQEMLRIRFE